MTPRGLTSAARPVALWLGVTALTGSACGSVPGAWTAAPHGAAPRDVADLVVAVCATGLALALAWCWTVTTVTVVEVLRGTVRTGGGATRRLVLLACGVAVVAGTSLPAAAAGGDGRELLVGLALPERAVAPPEPPGTQREPADHRVHDPAQDATTYVVRPGDSLWSIARAHPDGAGSVDLRWRAIWHANRHLVGDDPDLIVPGQALRLPTTRTPSSDGDR